MRAAAPTSLALAGALFASVAVAQEAAPSAAPPEAPPPEAPAGLGALSGRLFAHLRVPTSNPIDDPLQQASTSIWLAAHPRFNETASAHAVVSLDALQSAIDPDTHLRANVREGYVDAVKNGWDVRLGQQILPWGNADCVNPTDFLTAKDLTFFSVDPEVRRFGALSGRGSWTPNGGSSPFEFTVVATPVFPSSRLIVPPGLLPAGVTNVGLVRPPVTLGNAEVAARASYTGSRWDVALVAFRGFNHTPEYFLVSHDAVSTVIGQTNRRQAAVGAEGSLTAGKWVFRAEAAYVVSDNPTMADPTRQPSHFDAVAGVERSFFEHLRVQLQGVVRVHPYYQDVVAPAEPDPVRTAIVQSIASANALLLGYQDQVRPAASLRVAYATDDGPLEAEATAYVSFRGDSLQRSDYLLRPMLTYHWTDALKGHLGVEYYGGPAATPLGALNPFSGVFTEAAYAF